MIHQMSQRITDFLIIRGVIEKTDADIYVYGYETLISGIIDFILTMIVGFYLKCPLNALIFFVMFVSVRLYTGGYHADTYVKCKVTMILILLTVLGLSFIALPLSAVAKVSVEWFVQRLSLSTNQGFVNIRLSIDLGSGRLILSIPH